MTLAVWHNKNVIRLQVGPEKFLYWNGAWFIYDPGNATKYTPEQAARLMDAIQKSAKLFGAIKTREPELWNKMAGRLEVCVCTIVKDSEVRREWVPRLKAV